MKSSRNKKFPEELKSSFPEQDRKMMERFWDQAGETKRANIQEATSEEIEQQLSSVMKQIKSPGPAGPENERIHLQEDHKSAGHSRRDGEKPNIFYLHSRKLAAAAIALISLMAGSYWYIMQQPIEIHAPRGEMIETTLPDGTEVELNSGSSLQYSRSFGEGHRNVELLGEAYFNVEPGETNFQVETHNAVLIVTSTSFNIRSWMTDRYRDTSVMMESGRAEFLSRADPDNTVLLQDGYFSTIEFEQISPSEPEQKSINDVMAWRNRGFYFSGEPLAYIFEELERRFNITIEVDDPEILDITHSLYLSEPNGAEDVMETLSQSLEFEYQITEDQFIVSR